MISLGQAACTMDALICADGAGVGRSGPNCEFDCSRHGGFAKFSDLYEDGQQSLNVVAPKIPCSTVEIGGRCMGSPLAGFGPVFLVPLVIIGVLLLLLSGGKK